MIVSENFNNAKEQIRKTKDRFIRKYESEILNIPQKQLHRKIKSFQSLINEIDLARYEIINAFSNILTTEEKDKLKSIYEEEIYTHFFKNDE